AMRALYDAFNYVADPHGAVGYLGLQAFQKAHPNYYGIFLETAHPIKFPDVVEETLELKLNYPSSVQKLLDLEKKFERISTYADLKAKLLK
ncbi:MAG: threonine synthase, partial [Flavobacterium sp.]|nr:threonine synthase [Flavobacterium sp.]